MNLCNFSCFIDHVLMVLYIWKMFSIRNIATLSNISEIFVSFYDCKSYGIIKITICIQCVVVHRSSDVHFLHLNQIKNTLYLSKKTK